MPTPFAARPLAKLETAKLVDRWHEARQQLATAEWRANFATAMVETCRRSLNDIESKIGTELVDAGHDVDELVSINFYGNHEVFKLDEHMCAVHVGSLEEVQAEDQDGVPECEDGERRSEYHNATYPRA